MDGKAQYSVMVTREGRGGKQQLSSAQKLRSKGKNPFCSHIQHKTNTTKFQDSDKRISLQFLRIMTKELIFKCSCLNVYLAIKGSEMTLSLKKRKLNKTIYGKISWQYMFPC